MLFFNGWIKRSVGNVLNHSQIEIDSAIYIPPPIRQYDLTGISSINHVKEDSATTMSHE